jgi:hypothetical protein
MTKLRKRVREQFGRVRSVFPSRPLLSNAQRLYSKFFLIAFGWAAGVSLLILGVVLLAISGIATSISGVVISSASIGVGSTLVIAVYLWLTTDI